MVLPKGDITETVVKTLKLDRPLPRKVIERTQDALSLLRFRNAVGTFGRYDHERKRACAILEFEAREQCGVQIPMDKLAKVAYMRKPDFVQFHQTIGNFRDNMKASSTKTQQKKDSASSKNSNSNSNQSSNLQKSSIDRLAVQLGAFVPNSSVVASQAQKLFRTIHSHLRDDSSNSNASGKKASYHKRMQALQDLQRNQQVYEASCFFLVATIDSTNSQRRRVTMRPTDDSNDKPLDLSTFLNATTHSFSKATFEMVLNYVKELQEEIVQARGGQTAAATATKKYVPSSATARMQGAVKRKKDSNRKAAAEAASAQEKRLKSSNNTRTLQSTTDMVLQIAAQQDSNDIDKEGKRGRDRYNQTHDEDIPRERYPLSPKFLELKRKIVQASCLKAKESLKDSEDSQEQDKSAVDATEKESESTNWLDVAVKQVLQQHGLL